MCELERIGKRESDCEERERMFPESFRQVRERELVSRCLKRLLRLISKESVLIVCLIWLVD